MLESGAIQARGGEHSLGACSMLGAFAVESRPVHVHGIGIQIGSYPCRTHDKRNRPRLLVKPRCGVSQFISTSQGRGCRVRSPRRPPLCRDIGHELFNDRLMSS
jgi:hypothetical protein